MYHVQRAPTCNQFMITHIPHNIMLCVDLHIDMAVYNICICVHGWSICQAHSVEYFL